MNDERVKKSRYGLGVERRPNKVWIDGVRKALNNKGWSRQE